jgi:hypothetical protein
VEAHHCLQKFRTGSGHADLSIQVCAKGGKEDNNKAHDNFSGVDLDDKPDGTTIVSCPDITIHQNELIKNQSYISRAEMLFGPFLVLALEMDGWVDRNAFGISEIHLSDAVVRLTYALRLFRCV